MPVTKRARRHARERNQIAEGTTRWQLLMWGCLVLPKEGPDFQNRAEEMQAWAQHRSTLMQQAEPGMRPAGYFKFDLGIDPAPIRWFDQLDVLLDHGLLGPPEALLVERCYSVLASVDSPGRGCWHSLSARSLESSIARFALAARWHDWRGRPALAAQYRQQESDVRKALRNISEEVVL